MVKAISAYKEVFDFNYVMYATIIILLATIFILIKSFRKLKAQSNEISNFNELRKTYIDAHNCLIYLKDENLRYIFVNKAVMNFFDKTSEEIIGHSVFDFAENDYALMSNEIDEEVLRTKDMVTRENKWKDKVFKSIKFPVKLSNGNYGVGAYVEDVTEARKLLTKYRIERSKFLQTLISIGDAVIVVDLEGKVTMINKVAEKLTGWTYYEALGRHYKEVFVISHENPKLSIIDPIEEVLKTDRVQELGGNAVLNSRTGARYYLEDSAAPIKDNCNNTSGVVLVFRDISEKKEQRDKIEYLGVHDSLTGLYNRMFFEEEARRLDRERNLPISIIVADMNALKLTNDIFGHDAGDQLLIKAANVFKSVCRADDIIARVGGDEFFILLPKTTEEEAKSIIDRITREFKKVKVEAVRGSISMGCATKYNKEEDLSLVKNNADKKMYYAKTLDRENDKNSAINEIIDTLHGNNPWEKEHSDRVSIICENLGKGMGLSEVEVRKLKEAGYLHDIGKITYKNTFPNNKADLTEQEKFDIKLHPIVGYRILNSFEGTLDLAETILAHHEEWDGSGYPKGLKGEEIPLLARIVSVAECYDELTNKYNDNPLSREEALIELKKLAGTKFDPAILEKLETII